MTSHRYALVLGCLVLLLCLLPSAVADTGGGGDSPSSIGVLSDHSIDGDELNIYIYAPDQVDEGDEFTVEVQLFNTNDNTDITETISIGQEQEETVVPAGDSVMVALDLTANQVYGNTISVEFVEEGEVHLLEVIVHGEEDQTDIGDSDDPIVSDDLDLGPHYDYPNNDMLIYYSDLNPEEEAEESEQEEEEIIEDIDGISDLPELLEPDTDFELGEPRPLEDVLEGDGDSPEGAMAAMANDVAFYSSNPLVATYGMDLADYRERQFRGLNINGSLSETLVFPDYEDDVLNAQGEGVIQDPYIGIIDIHGTAQPYFPPDGDATEEWVCEEVHDDSILDGNEDAAWWCDAEYDTKYDGMAEYMGGQEGTLFTWLDWRLEEDELPEEEIEDPVTHYEDPDEEEKSHQTQFRTDYRVTDVDHYRGGDINGDTMDTNIASGVEGYGAVPLDYEDTINRDVTFQVDGEISAEISEIHYERERDWIEDEREVEVEVEVVVEGTASGTASTVVEHDDGMEGQVISGIAESDTLNGRLSGSTDTTFEDTFEELDGEREIDVSEDVTIEVDNFYTGISGSGEVSGIAGSGTETEISGTIEEDVTMTVDASKTITVEYGYWDWWNDIAESDEGGWRYLDDDVYRVDSVDVSDTQDVKITDNNAFDVDQVSVEVQEDKYHNILDFDYGGWDETEEFLDGLQGIEEGIPPENLDELFLWSMLIVDEHTIAVNDWRIYTKTGEEKTIPRDGKFYNNDDIEEDVICDPTARTDTQADLANNPDICQVDVPLQPTAFTFSKHFGPSIIESGLNRHTATELLGWDGNPFGITDPATHPPVRLGAGVPVQYHSFAMQDAASPVDKVVSIHGTTHEIHDDDTRIVPYAEPTIEFEDTDDDYIVRFTGENDEPLVGYSVVVEGTGDADGEYFTDSDGEIHIDIDADQIQSFHVDFEGDSLIDIAEDPSRDYYYGDVIAHNTEGGNDPSAYISMSSLGMGIYVSPFLILLYLLWRDFELGK